LRHREAETTRKLYRKPVILHRSDIAEYYFLSGRYIFPVLCRLFLEKHAKSIIHSSYG
jgi:hypothetical protein